MIDSVLIYGAYGFVGEAATRQAVERGMRPILAGRNAGKLASLAAELGLEYRVFALTDQDAIDAAMQGVGVVLHCAGPFADTYRPVLEACLRHGAHYLDITGEIPVYQAIAARDGEARSAGVMLMPGVGFDVVPSDCLALHLKKRLPDATHLTLAFQVRGPAGLPPGTQRTAIRMLASGTRVRRDGELVTVQDESATREIDFGAGPKAAVRLTWGDIFTAYHSTGIPNIEDYAAIGASTLRRMNLVRKLRPLLKSRVVRRLLEFAIRPGPSAEAIAATETHVWGEVRNANGGRAAARLHGPEPGVAWTVQAALAVVEQVMNGRAPSGYRTPAQAYGADFVLQSAGVRREDVE